MQHLLWYRQFPVKTNHVIMPPPVSLQGHYRTVMQAQEVLRQLRVPELDELREYVRALPANALMGMGAIAALTTYWFAFRPKAIKPRCDINQQSEELPVRKHANLPNIFPQLSNSATLKKTDKSIQSFVLLQ